MLVGAVSEPLRGEDQASQAGTSDMPFDPFSDQELRNSIYRGPYNDLLVTLSGDPDFMELMGFNALDKRFLDVEYVLRFAAFLHATYLKYEPPMSRFLTEDMAEYQALSSEKADELQAAFKNSLTLVRSLLGRSAFKRFYRGDSQSPGGRWEAKQFNASLYDVLMNQFATADKDSVLANLDAIREALIVLMTEDQEFINAIESPTNSWDAVRTRFDKWRKALEAILTTPVRHPRCFSLAVKQGLYTVNARCGICRLHIADLDDAALDHVEMYWLASKSIPEDTRLAHRYCKWAREKSARTRG